mmetsp:Transcript_52048/g.166741  ORF Transcript_52048/g.166741 Transcript_52048/m.166741 type:complete len:531 (+) Transcript_52048:150-1742(+)
MRGLPAVQAVQKQRHCVWPLMHGAATSGRCVQLLERAAMELAQLLGSPALLYLRPQAQKVIRRVARHLQPALALRQAERNCSISAQSTASTRLHHPRPAMRPPAAATALKPQQRCMAAKMPWLDVRAMVSLLVTPEKWLPQQASCRSWAVMLQPVQLRPRLPQWMPHPCKRRPRCQAPPAVTRLRLPARPGATMPGVRACSGPARPSLQGRWPRRRWRPCRQRCCRSPAHSTCGCGSSPSRRAPASRATSGLSTPRSLLSFPSVGAIGSASRISRGGNTATRRRWRLTRMPWPWLLPAWTSGSTSATRPVRRRPRAAARRPRSVRCWSGPCRRWASIGAPGPSGSATLTLRRPTGTGGAWAPSSAELWPRPRRDWQQCMCASVRLSWETIARPSASFAPRVRQPHSRLWARRQQPLPLWARLGGPAAASPAQKPAVAQLPRRPARRQRMGQQRVSRLIILRWRRRRKGSLRTGSCLRRSSDCRHRKPHQHGKARCSGLAGRSITELRSTQLLKLSRLLPAVHTVCSIWRA